MTLLKGSGKTVSVSNMMFSDKNDVMLPLSKEALTFLINNSIALINWVIRGLKGNA